LIDGDPHGRQRVLDLVSHAPRHFPEGPEPLGLELAPPRGVERTREIAQCLPQRFELRSAAHRRAGRQWLAELDVLRPAHQLVDRSRQLAGEVAGHTHAGEQDEAAEQHDDDREAGRQVLQVGVSPAGEADRAGDLREVATHRQPRAGGEPGCVHPLQHGAGGLVHLLERGAGAGDRGDRPDREHPTDHR